MSNPYELNGYDASKTSEFYDDLYRFEFDANGQLVALYEYDDGAFEREEIDTDETYSLQSDGTVIKSEYDEGGIEKSLYTDDDGDGLYRMVSDEWQSLADPAGGWSMPDLDDSIVSTFQTKGYMFEFDATGAIVALYESEDGILERESIERDEVYTLQPDGTVIKTESEDGGTETTIYGDSDQDGIFQRVSETWSPSGQAGNAKTLSYKGFDDDDYVAVRGGDDAFGGMGADQFVIREGSHLRIMDFNDDEGDHLIFDTGYGLGSVLDLNRYVTEIEASGTDLIVNFGDDISITLVGVAGDSSLDWGDVSVLS